MKRVIFSLLLGLLAFALATCEKPPEAGKKVLVMVPKGVHPYYGPCWQGFQDAAKKYGVEALQVTPAAMEANEQVKTLENVVSQHPAGIAISADGDRELINVIDKATAAGIKVITFDAPAPSTKALAYIGTLNQDAGYKAGVELARLMNNQGDVAVLQGSLGSPNHNERFEGFQKALKEKAPNIRIVAREATADNVKGAVDKTENFLSNLPTLKAIFGISSECIPGVAPTLKRHNKTDIIVAGFDDAPETIAAIKDGTCAFCLAQQTYDMGWMSVEKLLDATNGKTLEKQYDTGVILVTKDNLDTYKKDSIAKHEK